jgi:opacity protein-like surface antigen
VGPQRLRVFGAICALAAATTVAWADPASSPSSAPDPTPAMAEPYSWAGVYITKSGTLSAALSQTTEMPLNDTAAGTSISPGSGASTDGIDSGTFSANWQNGSAVVGLAGDMQWANQYTGAFSACGLGCSLNDRVRVPWLATLRARAGTAFDRVFVYGTGGLATLGMSDNLNAGGSGTMPNVTNFSTGNLDWTIGAGMEMALDKDVSAKVEYLYMPGSSSASAPGSLFDSSGDPIKNNILRGGINYRLPVGGE